jgi:hypothetical protein
MGGWDSSTGGQYKPLRAGDAGATASGRGNKGSFAADTFSAPDIAPLTFSADNTADNTAEDEYVFDWDAAEVAVQPETPLKPVEAPSIPAAPPALAPSTAPAFPTSTPVDTAPAKIDWSSVETRMIQPLTEAYINPGFGSLPAVDETVAPAVAEHDPWFDLLPKETVVSPSWSTPAAEPVAITDPEQLMAINDADIAAGWMGTTHRQWDERRRKLTDEEQRVEQGLSLEVLFIDRDSQHLLREGTPGAVDVERHPTGMLSGNPVTSQSRSLMRRIDIHNAGLVARGASVFNHVPHRVHEYLAVAA